MYCYNCGKQIEDDSMFCPFCGTKMLSETNDEEVKEQATNVVESAPVNEPIIHEVQSAQKEEEIKTPIQQEVKNEPVLNTQNINTVNSNVNASVNNNVSPKKNKAPLIIAICAFAVTIMVGVIILVLTVFGGNNIKVLDNVELIFEGYNGYGSPTFSEIEEDFSPLVTLQEEVVKMSDEYYNVCELGNIRTDKCQQLIEKAYYLGQALETIEYSYATTNDKPIDELSNGDTVTIKIDYDKDAFKKAGYKLKNTSRKYKVEGLVEPEEIDILSYAIPEWKRNGGEFYLSVEASSDCPIDTIPCTVSEVDDNGDVIITVDGKSLASNYGYFVKEENKSKSVFVGKAPRVIDSINDDNREQVENLALNTLLDVYISKCGYNLYPGDKQELLDAPHRDNIESISVSNGMVYVTFTLTTYEGGQYRKSISFDGYIDSEGNYRNATEYDRDSLSCAIEYGTWPEH